MFKEISYPFFALTFLLTWSCFSNSAKSVNCPNYGCLPRVIDNKIFITETDVTGEAAGIQYHKAFIIDCTTGQYKVLHPHSRQQIGSGNIYRVSAEDIDSIMAATIGLSCKNKHRNTQTESCNQVISNVIRQLETGRDLNADAYMRDISVSYSSYPLNRPNEYVFPMSGQAVNSVLSSPQFMTIISTTVIESCDSVGKVTFGLSGSGVAVAVGLLRDGTINIFTCADSGDTQPRGDQKLEWGTYYCFL